jgi:hypothetical protein
MNDEAQAVVDRILAAGPSNATEADMEFLTARRSYLTEEQKAEFGITDETAPKAKTRKAKDASEEA